MGTIGPHVECVHVGTIGPHVVCVHVGTIGPRAGVCMWEPLDLV